MADDQHTNSCYGKIRTTHDIGQAIRVRRREGKIRQDAAASLCGVGAKFLSQLENGKETAELGKALQVLRRMGLELYIFPRSANPLEKADQC